ncbi:hypothetical protein ACOMHN_018166 [Nucella lapillus]
MAKIIVIPDRFEGVTVDCSQQKFSSDKKLIDVLKAAIVQWKKEGRRGLWVKVQRDRASLIPLLTQLGLDFHHAQPGYVMMTLWMCDDQPNHLPEYANQYIGVAGFVVNADNKLLVIRENVPISKSASSWKLPGGHADKGEDLADTARREVLEETGIDSELISLLAFRHMHQYRYGCSDLYFVCLMRPLTTDIKPCPVEVADCRWMDLDEYINNDISDANRHFAQCYKDGLKHKDIAIVPRKVPPFDRKGHHKVYSIAHGSQSEPQQGST